jgi:RNA polymerase sigma-70 factor (ECF subfamily)
MSKSNSNAELFSLIAGGDKIAFDKFFDIYYIRLVNFSNLFLKDKSFAEDVVAEVLTNILLEKERIFRLSNFESYLYAAVKNKSLTHLSKFRKEFSVDWSETPGNNPIQQITPQQLMEEKELEDFISNLIDHLPKKRKMVFQLIREDGLTYKQVAEIMDISDRTVEVHLKLAIQYFRKKITAFLGGKDEQEIIQKKARLPT